jgi:hypothetical protein
MRAKRYVGVLKATTSLVLVAMSSFAAAQTAVVGTADGANKVIVYPNVTWAAGSCPANLTSNIVSGTSGRPHGVGFYGSDFALVSSFSSSQIFNVQLSTAATLNTINSGAFGYTGTGTIAVAPSLNFALAQEGSSLKVIAAPFTAPTATSVVMPGSVAGYQTQAIVFNSASRAFISHSGGVSVVDPPYTSVAFTMAIGPAEAITITPDGNTIMVTSLSNTVRIVTGPFSAASTAVTLSLSAAGASQLDGLYTTPDGSQTLVVDAGAQNSLFVINAPYSASSTVQKITLPAGAGTFEDVSISADGLFALLTGNSSTGPLTGVRAPFTTAGATACNFPITGGRGAGAVRFLPTNLQPPPGPAAGPVVVPTLSPGALAALLAMAALAGLMALRRRG